MAIVIPSVTKQKDGYVETRDIFSSLLEDRIILLTGEINDISSATTIAQLLHLESQDSKKDIKMYIDSFGGIISSGLAIYDCMKYVRPDIVTIVTGMAASMGAILLSAGKKGKRYALHHSRIMIHQPFGGITGQTTDVTIFAQEIEKLRSDLNIILAANTGKKIEKVKEDTERNRWMNPTEAKEYGIIDKIIMNKK